ncbi:MAG: helix-turn-helix domain-containing protein [Saprospiraceae bacterium]
MEQLKTGEFFGQHYHKTNLTNLILTDTEYTHHKVDWHYHENPYFTYLLQGKLFESNQRTSYYLEPGSLLFHNWQDKHYNIKSSGFTRGFHIELNANWFQNFDIKTTDFEGSLQVKSPVIKNSFNKIFLESKINDSFTNLSIDSLLLEIFSNLKDSKDENTQKPAWVNQLKDLLYAENIDFSLNSLSTILGIHPVHISREFRRYFGTSLGDYLRLIKVNQAFKLIVSNRLSMTEICYRCGFSDQSHFISNFKRVYQLTPTKLLRQITKC